MKSHIFIDKNKSIIYFKNWKRKKHAVFLSLKRIIKICALCLAYSILIYPVKSKSQEIIDTIYREKEYDLEEVVITGSLSPTVYSEVARIITVISKDEIEQAPVQSIQDLLDYALNVDIRQRGAFGVQTDVYIRGGTFDQVLILVDGVNIIDPQTGHYHLNLPINIESVEKIEILNGAAARVYGANAFNGVINIITTKEHGNSIKVGLSAGQHLYQRFATTGNLKIRNVYNHLDISNTSSKGYTSNTHFNIFNTYYKTITNTKLGIIQLQSGFAFKDFGANYLPEYDDETESIRPGFINLNLSTNKSIKTNSNLYWRKHKDHFTLKGNTNSKPWEYHNHHLTNTLGANINIAFNTQLGKSSIGFDLKSYSLKSNSMGDDLNKLVTVYGYDSVFYNKSYSRLNSGVFLEHNFNIKKISISSGFMINYYNDIDEKFKFYPGIDISYYINHNLKLFSSVNKTLRVPTFTDLLYSTANTFGNRDLLPEEALVGEMGAKFINEGIKLQGAVFIRKAKNTIDWVQTVVDSNWKINHKIITELDTIWFAKNISELITYGFELSVNCNLHKYFGSDFFINNIGLNYSYLDMNKPSVDYISKYALDNLKHNFNLFINHKLFKEYFSVLWKATYQKREGTITLLNKKTNLFEQKPYNPFWLVDVRLNFYYKFLTFYFEGSNLLNSKYYELGNELQPGRWLRFGITICK
ncbi:MAG: TonB-dependent receptor [Bacteroidales bacterium]|nr:TonB-dependent receptor [Bacteroidales bacterium]